MPCNKIVSARISHNHEIDKYYEGWIKSSGEKTKANERWEDPCHNSQGKAHDASSNRNCPMDVWTMRDKCRIIPETW